MANVKLGLKPVGSIIKIKIDGVLENFIVVHQGRPSSVYDASCDGTWVLMQDIYTNAEGQRHYPSSGAYDYLTNTFYSLIDSTIQSIIKTVHIKFNDTISGQNGIDVKVFLLSSREVGFDSSSASEHVGSRLAYFDSQSKRVAYYNGKSAKWYLRDRYEDSYFQDMWCVRADGSGTSDSSSYGIRPAFILPQDIRVSEDGTLCFNSAPTIRTDSAAIGENNAPFSFRYTVADIDGDTLTVTERLDGKTTKTRTGIASGATLTFEKAASSTEFQKILNGNHSISITASDGEKTASASATFSKAVHSASVTLAEPLVVDGSISVAVLLVSGFIPEDAIYKVEVTNNALDDSPEWQDATAEVLRGANIVFENKVAEAGSAFNFKVKVTRGPSNEGGYIEAVSGAFQ